ncbi:MAG: AAA family ATPase, partial [Candidatus Heimdallarchaeota archaeon]
MTSKVKLFQKITLENLMLHEHTQVDLAKEAITLITGANGSGKTQILDGLIICLGHIPTRAKAKGIGSLVGKHAEHAKVTLEISNPISNNRRAIYTMDKDLNSVINFDTFKITAKVSQKDNSITYSINNSRKIIRGRLVARRDIRRIFDTIGVRGENKLAFTGEGTVDEFASKSPKRKLDVLLEVTGLKQYREEVIASQETLRNSIHEIEPLKRKLETESKLLDLWNDAMKILNQKKKLMLMKKKLEIELAWSHVARAEKQVEAVNKDRLKILKQKSDNDKAIQQKNDEIALTTRRLKVLNDELDLIEEQEDLKNRSLITFETKLNYEDENIRNFAREIESYKEQKDKMQKILDTKDLSVKDRKLQDRQEALIVKTKKLSMLQEKYAKGDQELQLLRKKVIMEPGFDLFNADEEVYSGKRLTNFEDRLVTSAKIFSQKINKQGLEKDIVGPIISHIRMKEGKKPWEKAVKNLIGKNLYAFIAKTDESYRYAKRLYDETWPRWKPPLTVYKVTADDAKKASVIHKKAPYKEVYDIATNLIDGNPHVVGLLKRLVKGALSEDKYDPNILTRIAKETRVNILTKSGSSFYLSHGGFGRPPAPMKNPLEWKIKASETKFNMDVGNERQIRVTIARLEKITRDLKINEIKTLQEISSLHIEIQTIGMPDEKLLGKIETIDEIASVIEAKIKECKIHQSDLKLKLEYAADDFDSYAFKRVEIKKRIYEIQETSDLLKLELHSLKEKSSRLLTIEITLDVDYDSLNDEKKEKIDVAEAKGERPEEIRLYSVIRDEKSRIEGHLESIGISNVD